MAKVIAPLFSLSASGLIGKTIFYYDTKYGARVRKVKGRFDSPSNIWEVNKAWFKQASDRWKYDLPACAKWAWNKAFPLICDNGRDLFMGRQIEMWNLSHLNMVTWPNIGVPDVGSITFWTSVYSESVKCGFDEFDVAMVKKWNACILWARKLDDATYPGEDDIIESVRRFTAEIDFVANYTNYIWGGIRYLDGSKKMFLVGSYVK